MPEMTNPYHALIAFQAALEAGAIDLQICRTDPGLALHADAPNGQPRLTHAYISEGLVRALAMVVGNGTEKGLPCFDMGYAVHENLMGQGLGAKIAAATAKDFKAGMKRAESRLTISKQW